MSNYPIAEVILHCSATRPGWLAREGVVAKTEEIRRWHLARGWRDIGYHFLVDRDGTLSKGRPVHEIGAHTRSHNRHTLGICLIGGHGAAATDSFGDHFTEPQREALRQLLAWLREETGFDTLSGHNDYAAKGCPGFKVQPGDWL